MLKKTIQKKKPKKGHQRYDSFNFLKKMFKKKSAMKGTTKDNIKFHMEEMILRKIKLKYTFQLIENRSVTQIDKYRHI